MIDAIINLRLTAFVQGISVGVAFLGFIVNIDCCKIKAILYIILLLMLVLFFFSSNKRIRKELSEIER